MIIRSMGSVTRITTQNLASIAEVTLAASTPRRSPCQIANSTQQTVVSAKMRFIVNRGRQFGGINGGGSGSGMYDMARNSELREINSEVFDQSRQ